MKDIGVRKESSPQKEKSFQFIEHMARSRGSVNFKVIPLGIIK